MILLFIRTGSSLLPYKLSSGEKADACYPADCVWYRTMNIMFLFMDEPESLAPHRVAAQKLIAMIRELNPQRTNYPDHPFALPLIMEGWLDAVTEVSDITNECG